MSIQQPRWKIPLYGKVEVNNAGDIIRSKNASSSEKEAALKVIDNWRAAHAYPLHVFYINLRRKARQRDDIIVVERLKRLDSIVDKLDRYPKMKLYRMQDLGGCRVVVPTLDEVYAFSDMIQKSQIRHEPKTPKDYINNPKPTGYRSLHLIYKFKSRSSSKEIYNNHPMLIEIQLRTHLQHIWATAVETIGVFTNQALKSGYGDEEIKRFFVLVSSLFAIQENCPVCPNTSENKDTLIKEIKEINKSTHILEMLRGINASILRDDIKQQDRKGYYILVFDYADHTLTQHSFKPSEYEIANEYYDLLESKKGDQLLDIVLIRASSYSMLKAAYPNYFLDISEFIDLVSGYLR